MLFPLNYALCMAFSLAATLLLLLAHEATAIATINDAQHEPRHGHISRSAIEQHRANVLPLFRQLDTPLQIALNVVVLICAAMFGVCIYKVLSVCVHSVCHTWGRCFKLLCCCGCCCCCCHRKRRRSRDRLQRDEHGIAAHKDDKQPAEVLVYTKEKSSANAAEEHVKCNNNNSTDGSSQNQPLFAGEQQPYDGGKGSEGVNTKDASLTSVPAYARAVTAGDMYVPPPAEVPYQVRTHLLSHTFCFSHTDGCICLTP